MRSVTGTRIVHAPPDVAFARLAAFESTASWDPGVRSARRMGDEAPRVGTHFEVEALFLGVALPMTYEMLECDAPRRLRLVGRAARSTAWDTIRFEPCGEGTRITWTLELSLRGVSRLGEPFLGPVLRRLARKALDGLAADLDSRAG